MKKMVLLIMGGLITSATLFAQGGGYQRRTVEERVKAVENKLDSAFKLDKSKLDQSDSIFAIFYRSTDKVREELMSGGQRPDMTQVREKMQPAVDERDKQLQTVLTSDQFKVWKDEIEPSMRQKRQGGNGGRG